MLPSLATSETKVIDQDLINEINECAQEKQKFSQGKRVTFRTFTRYITAKPMDRDNRHTARFSPCKLVSEGGHTPILEYNNVFPPSDGQVVEGRIKSGSNYLDFPFCNQYRFYPPIAKAKRGVEKFDTFAGLDSATQFWCQAYTGGGGSGKGGGHVYSNCSLEVGIIWNKIDLQIAKEICTKEILGETEN